MTTYNIADLFELVAGAHPDRQALVTPPRRLTYRQLDERANRLAHHLQAAGIGRNDHVGLHLENGTEYVEGMIACYKLAAVPININFRYVEAELRHLYRDAELRCVIVGESFAPSAAAVAGEIPTLTSSLIVGSAATHPGLPSPLSYEQALAAASPDPVDAERSSDDIYIAYTGGTTGMPKGVMWRHEDIFFAALGGGDPFRLQGPIDAPEQLLERVAPTPAVTLIAPPLMHVAGHWTAFMNLLSGSTVVMPSPGRLVPEEIWRLVAAEKVNVVTIVGDAMARPLASALGDLQDLDLSSLIVIGSGGAILSAASKAVFASVLPNVMVVDGYGSSETGTVAGSIGGDQSAGPVMAVGPDLQVFDEDGQPVPPGSGRVGVIARSGHIPLGYYGDEEKTRATFRHIDGKRWSVPGDSATVEADGTIRLLGRGSVSINTGGEKVYPEEVEQAVKHHPDVLDAVIVGVPDERWGERVTAVVATASGQPVELDDLQAVCRQHVAGYKVPRAVVHVPTIERLPNGKTDYRWARDTAAASTA